MTSSKMHEFGQFSLFSVIEAIYLFLYDKRVRRPEGGLHMVIYNICFKSLDVLTNNHELATENIIYNRRKNA